MSTNEKLTHLLIIILITAPTVLLRLQPQQQGCFLPQISYFYICFRYLKTVALIILNKTENHKEDLFLKIYALILVILICYLNLQHLKKT